MTQSTKPARTAEPPAKPFCQHLATGEAIATLLHPYAEVVLHDLDTKRIVRIWNSFTDRQAGDLSNLNDAQTLFQDDTAVLGPYEKALSSQGRSKSITAGLRDDAGKLFGLLCINLDVTLVDRAQAMMAAFASCKLNRPEPIYRNDIQQHINYLIRDYSVRANKPIERLTRAERASLVSMIDREGIFQARNSVSLVARTLGISRASVYNILAESKGKDEAAQVRPD